MLLTVVAIQILRAIPHEHTLLRCSTDASRFRDLVGTRCLHLLSPLPSPRPPRHRPRHHHKRHQRRCYSFHRCYSLLHHLSTLFFRQSLHSVAPDRLLCKLVSNAAKPREGGRLCKRHLSPGMARLSLVWGTDRPQRRPTLHRRLHVFRRSVLRHCHRCSISGH